MHQKDWKKFIASGKEVRVMLWSDLERMGRFLDPWRDFERMVERYTESMVIQRWNFQP